MKMNWINWFTSTDGRLFDVTFAMVNPRNGSLFELMAHKSNSIYFPSHSLHNSIVRLRKSIIELGA